MKRALTILSALVLALFCAASCGPGHETKIPFGSEAKDFLAKPVSLEILPVMGREPSGEALDLLARRLKENGSGLASVTTHAAIVDARRSWTSAELLILERDHQPSPLAPATLVLLYCPGFYRDLTSVVALNYGPHSIAVFADGTQNAAKEARFLLHELGHVLGLVQGLRADRLHPRHDLDPQCVMFWFEPFSDDFCSYCKADLSAARRL